MQLHGPKRIYTRESLEFWFEKLETEWDPLFSPEHLDAGREMYRTGGIREIELSARDAIVHCRVEKKDEYSVLEWTESGLVVRSSSGDRLLANAIAVAGMHEIEELIADELTLVPEEQPAASRSENGNGLNSRSDRSAGMLASGARSLAGRLAPADPVPPGRSGDAGSLRAATPLGTRRELLLRFRVAAAGLVCEPWWIDGARSAAPAMVGNGRGNGKGNGGGAASPIERMKLISLTAMARKSHFHFEAELGAFVLEETGEIPHFLKAVLPAWQRTFRVETEDAVENLRSGVRAVKVEARVRPMRGQGIDLEWVFRSGECLIDAAQVDLLRRANGAPVIIPEVGLVSLPAESWRSIEEWRDTTAQFGSSGLPSYLLFSLFSDRRYELALSSELETWRNSVMEAAPAGHLDLPDFLRPYQRRGVEWLAHLCAHGCHGLLADEMGLGKTVQVIALIAACPTPEKVHLVVCPASVVPVWQEEIRRFFPGTIVHLLKNGNDFRQMGSDGIWLASYAQLRNHRPLLESREFGYAVLDEGQFIKNPDAKVTNTCFEIRARHRVVLTGTPLENRQLDLWSILHFLLPGLLGTRSSFESLLQRDREATMERLRVQLAPFILRRTKAQVVQELPPKVEIDLLCPLGELQRHEYARVCREGLERLGDDISRAMREKSFGLLSLLTRLRQICCDPDLLPWLVADHSASGKLSLLVERLDDVVSSGHKVVIFSQFVMFLKRAREVLERQYPDIPRFELTGSTIDRQKPVQDFQSIDGPAFMLVSLKAAGTGITLHAADYVFLLDPWWNPSVEEQAIDRVHRIGQTRTVFVYRMVTRGTIEERIQALKAEKKQLFRQLIDGVSGDVDLGAQFKSLHQLIELTAENGDSGSEGDTHG